MKASARIRYSDLVEVPRLKALMESFSEALGVACTVVDDEGRVLVRAGAQPACSEFHRRHADCCRGCMESDPDLAECMVRGEPIAVRTCFGGLIESAAPITVDGLHLADLYAGQCLSAPPDPAHFRAQAARLGFDQGAYLEAIARLPVLPQERVEAVTRLYAQLAGLLASSGLDRLRQQEAAGELAALTRALEGKVHERTREVEQAHAELAAREALLKQIFDTSSVAIFLVDLEGRITQANQRMAEMFGRPLEVLVGSEYVSLIHPSERETGRQKMLALLASAIPSVSLERLYWRADHTEFWGHLSGKRFYDPAGREIGLVGVIADINERKTIETAVAISEARYRTLFSDNTVVMLLIDPAGGGRVVDANHAATRYYGYPLETLRTLRVGDINTLDPEQIRIEMQRARDGHRNFFEFRHRLADGSVRDVNVSSGPIELAGKSLLLSTVQDVTELKQAERSLRESERRFRSLFESIEHISVQGYGPDHRVIFWNRASEAFFGYRSDEALGRPIEALICPPPQQAEMSAAIDGWLAGGPPIPAGEQLLRHRDGHAMPVFSSHSLHTNGRDEPELYCVHIDLSARYEAEARMRKALVVFNSSSQGIMSTDAEGVVTAINPAFSAITGYSAEDVVGQKSSMFGSGRHDSAFFEAMWKSLDACGHWEGEIWNRRKSGEVYPQWMNISTVRDPQGTVVEYVALFSDITERKQHEEAIWRQANFDALTGLANRSLLNDRLDQALAQARRNHWKVGLVFLDLDGFKWINDTLGHDVGDELLVEVARRLRACIREQDTAARFGGDEFTIVVQGIASADDMLSIAEKLVSVLREPFMLAGRENQLSVSAGITVFPDDGPDVQTLHKNADIAMYKAKQAGKNRFQFYAPHMQQDAQARMQLEADLRSALACDQFHLHYQPIVDARSRQVVGAEALIRWQHPLRGNVSPLEFIPVAEDSGLITRIGEWVLRQAARQFREWRSQGHPPIRLSVNVSSVQFREDRLGGLIASILDDNAIDPGWLMLEITESMLMDSSKAAETRMREIKAQGIGYSLDDFGTGYSSLSYLKRFPVDVVKIDRSFVRDCPDDRSDALLVEAIINMAHSLGLRVTAEGVETQAQADFLSGLGCDTLQGYLIGRPLPADEFVAILSPAAAHRA